MQKLNDLESWTQVEARQCIKLPAEKKRRVRLHFNSPEPVALYLADASGKADRFLARVVGLETVEFYAAGALSIVPDGMVQYSTSEGQKTHVEASGKEVFTKIHERSARNHDLEMMTYIARENQRRMDETLAQNRAVLDELKRRDSDDKREGRLGDDEKSTVKGSDESRGRVDQSEDSERSGDGGEDDGG